MLRRLLPCALILGLASSCASIAPSALRLAAPEALSLNGASVQSTGLIAMTVAPIMFDKDFLPASFMIEAGGKRLYIDPVAPRDPLPADYILITHPHPDHYWAKSLKALKGDSTLILCPAGMAKKVAKETGMEARGLAAGDSLELEGLAIHAFPAYTIKAGALGINPHGRKEGYLSYRFEFGGESFFHTGDSNDLPEFAALADIDLLFLPIDGGDLSMSTEEAAAMANRVKPRFVAPMHYMPGKELERLRGMLEKDISIADLR